jgi:large subunit ribosomal protein L29
MKVTELRQMNDNELHKQLDDLYQEMFNLRFQRASGQLPNTNRLREVKGSIAQVKTLLRERELALGQRGGV